MANIKDSMPYLLENEGGWTIDDGGWTMWGVVVSDVAAYRHVPPKDITEKDMKNLSVQEATAIYKQQYWDRMSLDQVIDQNIATCIFDTGVNRGLSVGVKYAQKVCHNDDLVIDGHMGPKSLEAINRVSRKIFCPIYESLVWAGFQAIYHSNPTKYGIYLRGWDLRAKRLLTLE